MSACVHARASRSRPKLRRRAVESGSAPKRISPESLSTLDALAASLIKARRWSEAADVLRILLHLQPRAADGWVRLGGCELRQGRSEAARLAFERAVALDPGLERAQLGRTEALLQGGQRSKAERALAAMPPPVSGALARKARAMRARLGGDA